MENQIKLEVEDNVFEEKEIDFNYSYGDDNLSLEKDPLDLSEDKENIIVKEEKVPPLFEQIFLKEDHLLLCNEEAVKKEEEEDVIIIDDEEESFDGNLTKKVPLHSVLENNVKNVKQPEVIIIIANEDMLTKNAYGKCDNVEQGEISFREDNFEKFSISVQSGGGKNDQINSLKCTICHKLFGCHKDLYSHMQVHVEAKPFKCSACGESFTQPRYLKNHMLVHSKLTAFKCTVCGEKFTAIASFTNHMQVHGVKPRICHLCGEVFPSLTSLGAHFQSHVIKRNKPVQKRKKINPLPPPLQPKHLKTTRIPNPGMKPFICTECDEVCYNQYDLRHHFPVHISDKPLKCSQCFKEFIPDYYCLKTCLSSRKTPGIQLVKCPKCCVSIF